MNTFGIFLICWWALNSVISFYYAGQGGLEVTPGSLIIGGLLSIVWIVLLFTFGTA